MERGRQKPPQVGADKMRRRNFSNLHGLPGLPQTQMPLGNHRRPPPPPMRMPTRPPPPPRPVQHVPMQPPPQPITITQPDPMAERRMDMLEQRLNATEQSNRALLDELMRMQQDMKVSVKRNEMGVSEEKEARGRLESTLRQSQNKTFEYDDRIRRLEDALKEMRNSLQQMASHNRSIEKAVATAQQDQNERRSNSAQKLQEYRHEIMKMNQGREQLERLCYSLRDELREATSKLDNHSQELNSLEANVRMQGRLMEETSRRAQHTPAPMPTPMPLPMPLTSDRGGVTETEKKAIDGKIIQMNTMVQDLTQRLNQEAKKRERVETELNIRMNELLEDYGSTRVAKDQEMREIDDKLKELQAGFSASEKQRILMEISSVAQELSRKMDEKEAKLRDDTVNKLTVIEQTLLEENKRRAAKEKELQDQVETQMKESKVYGDAGADALKQHVDKHTEETQRRVGELTNNMNQLDAQVRDHVLQQEKVLAAEITERTNAIKRLDGKIDDVEERSRTGLLGLQSELGAANQRHASARPPPASPNIDELRELQQQQDANADGIRQQVAKDVAQLDQRLSGVETKLKQQEQALDNKLQSSKAEDQEANTVMGDRMQQQIDNVVFSQERLKKQVDSLQHKVQDTPKSLTELKEEVKEVDTKLNKKLDQERKERMDDVKEIRGDIDRIIGRDETYVPSVPSLARLNQDVDETQTGMKKLAEAVHVVKTSLSERVKDERKLREQEDAILRRDVERLGTKYNELREKVKNSTAVAAAS